MSLDDFFENKPSSNDEDLIKEDPQESFNESPINVTTEFQFQGLESDLKPMTHTLGEDIENVFLMDVRYERKENLAQALFYHEPSKSIYKWNDTSGHKPYLLTLMSKETVMGIDKIIKSPEFVGIEEVDKYLTLEEQDVKLTKIIGDNPLSIGGKSTSFREYVKPAYEADVRYHFNYVADKGLTPGTYYKVINGNLIQGGAQIDSNVQKELELAFANEAQEYLDMLDEYMPLLFQPIPDILRAAFDIEVGSIEGKLPNPNKPDEQIISIAISDSQGRKICWVLNTDYVQQDVEFTTVQVRRFDNELTLLEDFFYEIDKYPIVISFNGDNFDCPYLYNRSIRIGINKNDIPIYMKRNDTEFVSSVHVDLYKFFRQASIRLYAFGGKYESSSLDELSKSLLSEKKLDHPEVWINEMDLETLVKYNSQDADLTLRLTQFDDNIVLNLMFILTRICKMPLFDFSRIAVSGWLQNWLLYEHRKRNYLVPLKKEILSAKGEVALSEAIIEGKKYQGAIVLDPKPGVWWDVKVVDFASLYPSIIKTKNLSYETIRCEHDECRTNVVPEVGHWSCTRRLGLFSIVLGFIRDTRVNWFKPRSADKNVDDKERRINQVIQSSLKVLINAGYGVFGSTAFDYYCPPVAESTTAYARNAITETQKFVEETLDVRVLYGDTDSLFLLKISDDQIDELVQWGNENIGVELGIDYVFRYAVFTDRKKNYFGITTNNTTIVKGLMGKKSNTPRIIRDHFSTMLDILRQIQDEAEFDQAKDEITDLLRNLVSKLESGQFSVSDASIKLTLSRKLREYTTWTQPVQAIAQLLEANVIEEGTIDIGDTVEFIKLARPIRVNLPTYKSWSFPAGPREASVRPIQMVKPDEDLDGKPIIEFAESAFSQLLSSIGLSWDLIMGVQSLNDFF